MTVKPLRFRVTETPLLKRWTIALSRLAFAARRNASMDRLRAAGGTALTEPDKPAVSLQDGARTEIERLRKACQEILGLFGGARIDAVFPLIPGRRGRARNSEGHRAPVLIGAPIISTKSKVRSPAQAALFISLNDAAPSSFQQRDVRTCRRPGGGVQIHRPQFDR